MGSRRRDGKGGGQACGLFSFVNSWDPKVASELLSEVRREQLMERGEIAIKDLID